jgi:hypothetical protein
VEQVKRFSDTESLRTEFQADGMSSETRRAVMKLESELEKLLTGYAELVLCKDGIPPDIPDSLLTAETRLMSLKNRFSWNPEYERFYRAAMEKNFKEGYARRGPLKEIAERPKRYFLPHFGVPKDLSSRNFVWCLMGRPDLEENAETISTPVDLRFRTLFQLSISAFVRETLAGLQILERCSVGAG